MSQLPLSDAQLVELRLLASRANEDWLDDLSTQPTHNNRVLVIQDNGLLPVEMPLVEVYEPNAYWRAQYIIAASPEKILHMIEYITGLVRERDELQEQNDVYETQTARLNSHSASLTDELQASRKESTQLRDRLHNMTIKLANSSLNISGFDDE